MTLAERQVLFIDAQTTGASPARGHLLELSWGRARAQDNPLTPHDLRGSVVSLPEGETLPRRISELTGIVQADLEDAPSALSTFRALLAEAARLCEETAAPALAIIHYARFERAFLNDLQMKLGEDPLPLEIVCTHEIARRLFPDLPRRGIRALSGFLGHPVADLKRAPEHVLATATIWSELAPMLAAEGIHDLGALRSWLTHTRPPRRGKLQFSVDRRRRLSLPASPGVYRMVGLRGAVLYVGKATSLKARVNSYFQKQRGHSEKTLELLTCARELDITETGSALEAALLEADEIKRLDPPYNIALKARRHPIGFTTAELLPFGEQPVAANFIGPLPSPGALAPLRALRDILQTGLFSEADIALALGMPPESAPEPDCFSQGLDLFLTQHQLAPTPEGTLDALWRLGAKLSWRFYHAHKNKAEEEPEDEAEDLEDEGAPRVFEWSPEGVARGLEAMVAHRSKLARRGRWLCRLSESVLVWQPRHFEAGTQRILKVSRGDVVARETTKKSTWEGFSTQDTALNTRWKQFDPMVYDRLRVLTTELRRLVEEGGPIQLFLGRGLPMDAESLRKQLVWI